MKSKIPAICAALIPLRLTVARSAGESDWSVGLTVGLLLGISLLSLLQIKRAQ